MIETIKIEDREQWLALRQKDVTASVVGALLGVHDYTTKFELWAAKTGQDATIQTETKAMRRGRLLEDDAAQIMAEDYPQLKLSVPGVYLRDSVTRLGATPDLYVDCPERGEGIVQIKTTDSMIFRLKWLDPDTREIILPLWIAAQTITEMHLSGRKWGQVALLVLGNGLDLKLIDVPYHAGIMARIEKEVKAFWDFVASGETMPADYSKDADTIKNMRMAFDDATPIDLSHDNRLSAAIGEREDWGTKRSEANKQYDALTAEIRLKLGNHSTAICGNRKITDKIQHRAEHVVKGSSFPVLRIS